MADPVADTAATIGTQTSTVIVPLRQLLHLNTSSDRLVIKFATR